jgi:GNAT superfamily N-acetyltransferase
MTFFTQFTPLYFKQLFKPKINFYSIIQMKRITDDTWNKIPNSDVRIDFYEYNKNNKIGYISYRLSVGQIGLFFIEEPYRNRGLGKQILEQTIKEMKENNIEYIWCVTSKNHPFWSNIYNKKMIWCDEGKLHPSVRGYGYKMKI